MRVFPHPKPPDFLDTLVAVTEFFDANLVQILQPPAPQSFCAASPAMPMFVTTVIPADISVFHRVPTRTEVMAMDEFSAHFWSLAALPPAACSKVLRRSSTSLRITLSAVAERRRHQFASSSLPLARRTISGTNLC